MGITHRPLAANRPRAEGPIGGLRIARSRPVGRRAASRRRAKSGTWIPRAVVETLATGPGFRKKPPPGFFFPGGGGGHPCFPTGGHTMERPNGRARSGRISWSVRLVLLACRSKNRDRGPPEARRRYQGEQASTPRPYRVQERPPDRPDNQSNAHYGWRNRSSSFGQRKRGLGAAPRTVRARSEESRRRCFAVRVRLRSTRAKLEEDCSCA